MQTVYICQSEYDFLVARTREKYRYLATRENTIRLSPALFYYPNLDVLREKDVVNKFDRYYDVLIVFLVCWEMFPEPRSEAEAEEREKAHTFLKDVFDQQLVVIDDKDIMAVTEIPNDKFVKMTEEEKVLALEPLMVNFYENDFESFYAMIGKNAPLRPALKKRVKSRTEAAFKADLEAVWKSFFASF